MSIKFRSSRSQPGRSICSSSREEIRAWSTHTPSRVRYYYDIGFQHFEEARHRNLRQALQTACAVHGRPFSRIEWSLNFTYSFFLQWWPLQFSLECLCGNRDSRVSCSNMQLTKIKNTFDSDRVPSDSSLHKNTVRTDGRTAVLLRRVLASLGYTSSQLRWNVLAEQWRLRRESCTADDCSVQMKTFEWYRGESYLATATEISRASEWRRNLGVSASV